MFLPLGGYLTRVIVHLNCGVMAFLFRSLPISHGRLCSPTGKVSSLSSASGGPRNQIEGFDLDKFTLVVWDPPGYGQSRPPHKTFGPNFFHRDATLATTLLQKLGVDKYSILGWSDGGTTALIMASGNKKVDKLVVWGAISYVSQTDLKYHKRVTEVRMWPRDLTEPLLQTYGEDLLQDMVSKWYSSFTEAVRIQGGDICVSSLNRIMAPTLVLHGSDDPLVPEQHARFIVQRIPQARLQIFPKGKHSIHLRNSTEFNDSVQKFLLMNK